MSMLWTLYKFFTCGFVWCLWSYSLLWTARLRTHIGPCTLFGWRRPSEGHQSGQGNLHSIPMIALSEPSSPPHQATLSFFSSLGTFSSLTMEPKPSNGLISICQPLSTEALPRQRLEITTIKGLWQGTTRNPVTQSERKGFYD